MEGDTLTDQTLYPLSVSAGILNNLRATVFIIFPKLQHRGMSHDQRMPLTQNNNPIPSPQQSPISPTLTPTNKTNKGKGKAPDSSPVFEPWEHLGESHTKRGVGTTSYKWHLDEMDVIRGSEEQPQHYNRPIKYIPNILFTTRRYKLQFTNCDG